MDTVIITFLVFLFSFIIIGISSALKSRKTTEDYLIASRSVHPWLTSLSSAATNNSGYMFIGLIGFTYMFGLSSIWVQTGWIIGDYVAWKWFYKNIRRKSEEADVHTFPSFLGYKKDKGFNRIVIFVAGIITLVFLSTYAAAQLNAGGKALHVLFEWDYSTGAIIGAVIVVLYCVAGGIRASIWTDAAQAIIMLLSMSLLLAICFIEIGDPIDLYYQLQAIDPKLTNLIPDNLAFGISLHILGWVIAGFGAIGQPHIQIRTMSISSAEEIDRARVIYIGWFTLFSIATVLVGLYSRVILPDIEAFDPELALPALSLKLLPSIFVGLILAGLFSATMSTADSLVLSASAALTQDINPNWEVSRVVTKIGTVTITALVLLFALFAPSSVFELVLINWSVLGSAFGPIVVLRGFGKKINGVVALFMMLISIATVLVWRYALELTNDVYEILPGFIAGFTVYLIGMLIVKSYQRAKYSDS